MSRYIWVWGFTVIIYLLSKIFIIVLLLLLHAKLIIQGPKQVICYTKNM